jgi:hypothetical protein
VNGSTYINISSVVDIQGRFTQPAAAISADNTVQININAGVTGLTKDGLPLSQISLVSMANSPVPQAQTNLIGLTYNLGPDGATFSPPILLTFNFDPAALAPGVDPQTLALAYYDSATGLWINLPNIAVDTVNYTVAATTSHFTPFSIAARIPVLTTAPTIHSQPATSPPATIKSGEPPTSTSDQETAATANPTSATPAAPSPTIIPTPPASDTRINPGFIIGIIAAILIIGVIILLVTRRKN